MRVGPHQVLDVVEQSADDAVLVLVVLSMVGLASFAVVTSSCYLHSFEGNEVLRLAACMKACPT